MKQLHIYLDTGDKKKMFIANVFFMIIGYGQGGSELTCSKRTVVYFRLHGT